ncbi:MAG: cation diffusion facilitator family transporter [Spirochaetaceae bacterium]
MDFRKLERVTILGATVNVALAAAKVAVGVVASSYALIADGIHSLSDLVTDIAVFWGIRAAGRPPDANHRYGHGRFETLAAFFVGVVLILAGGSFGWRAAISVVSAIGGESLALPGVAALWVAAFSVLAKEGLYQLTVHMGREGCSPAVTANAWHHRADALSSVAAVLGIGAARLLGADWAVLDPAAGILVAAAVVWVGGATAIRAAREMTDVGLPENEQRQIVNEILKVPGVSDPHDLRTRRLGSTIAVEVHIRIDNDATVLVAHDLASDVEKRLRDVLGRETHVITHVEPRREEKRD